jgi:protein-L-isoaspartate(D-aspartate) O-methyltransferase
MDYAALRQMMVEEQLLARGIKDKRVLAAFSKVERHKFVSEDARENAYGDFPLGIGKGQTISQPFIVALMTECLGLCGDEKVLEIGTGSGYQTAILAELVREIYSIERIDFLARRSEELLEEMGYHNLKIKVGDGTLGWPEEAPFDRIIVTAATAQIPLPLTGQLKEGGKLILPLGDSFSQMLTLVTKRQGVFASTQVCPCVFVPLIGKFVAKDA